MRALGYFRSYMHKKRFGGFREAVLLRDDFKCVVCSMTNEKHKQTWGREITINHIDGQGRYSKEQNNNLDNLETLCLRCHGKKDATDRRRKFYDLPNESKKAILSNLFFNKGGVT